MKKVFVKTKNVKRFISLMEEIQNLPSNVPKLALVYGNIGLGKSQTIQWWVDKNIRMLRFGQKHKLINIL